jgi:hypothetical protein
MPNKGMKREISITKPSYKIIINQFLLQKITKDDTIIYIYYFVANFTFGIFFPKSDRNKKKLGKMWLHLCLLVNFQDFLEVMLLVKSKYA